MQNLTSNAVILRTAAAASAAQTTVTGTAVDLGPGGFNACTFAVPIVSISSGGIVTLTIEGSNNNSTWAPLVATDQSAVVGVLAVEVIQPRHRYLRGVVTRTVANSAIENVLAILTQPRDAPPDDATYVAAAFVAPAAA